MIDDPRDANIALENAALRLSWRGGRLAALNRVSGREHNLDFPAFALQLRGERLGGEDFTLAAVEATDREARFDLRHEGAGIEATVRYWIEGDEPWFRKQLTLRAPEGTPTPDRVWVDVQTDPPRPIRRVGYGLRGGPDAEEQT
ncbi:MAG TPA: hypothetical protein VM283_01770, partial [Armatimonadota bacterium]|nr:hypothetical protein [Armatimonadota bacterium]